MAAGEGVLECAYVLVGQPVTMEQRRPHLLARQHLCLTQPKSAGGSTGSHCHARPPG